MAAQEESISRPIAGYQGYFLRDVPDEDPELTHVGPGTAMGAQKRPHPAPAEQNASQAGARSCWGSTPTQPKRSKHFSDTFAPVPVPTSKRLQNVWPLSMPNPKLP